MKPIKIIALSVLLFFAACKEKSQEDYTFDFAPATRQATDYVLTAEGEMPPMPVTISITPMQSGDRILSLRGTSEISYAENGRNDRLPFAQNLQLIANQTWNLQFSHVIGGKLVVSGSGKVKDRYGNIINITCKDPLKVNVVGTNPAKEKVRSFINNKPLAVIIYLRSAFAQFDANGKPLFKNGFGLYSISNPTAEQIWNWKKNIDAANADFAARTEAAAKIPEQLRAQNPAEYKNLPDFSKDQLLWETVQSYGTGKYYYPKKNIFGKWNWQVATDNDGFAKKCQDILDAVAANKPPQGWN